MVGGRLKALEHRLQDLGYDVRLQNRSTILIIGKENRIVASLVRWSDKLVIQYGLVVPSESIARPWTVNRIVGYVKVAYSLESMKHDGR